jgi:PAS domain S-box-containing protein
VNTRYLDARMMSASRTIAIASCVLVGGLAAMTLVGWAADAPRLRAFVRDGEAMNPITAVALLFACLSLAILCRIEAGPGWRSRQVAQVLAGAVLLLGLQRLLAYMVHWPWALDDVLFAAKVRGNPMAPNTAACLVLVGAALLALDVESGSGRWRPAVWAALLPGVVGVLAITGYIYNVEALYGLGKFIAMALNTAVSFVTLSVGILCARPDKDPVATLVSRTAGGATARRLLPIALVAPLLLGWLRLQGEQFNLYPREIGVAAFAVAIAAVFVIMVYVSGRSLARAELRRQAAEDMLAASEAFYHTLVETLPQNIFRKDLRGRFTFGNSRFLGEIGKTREEVLGKTDFDFFPRELAERYRRDDQGVISSGKPFETVEEHVTPSGEKLYVQVIKTAVQDDTGRVIGTQGIFWDVTEKKRYEQALEVKNKQLEEAARAEREAYDALRQAQSQLVQSEKLAGLGQMVAGVAHEINNPLAFVGNNVVVMQRDVGALRKLLDLYRGADGTIPPELKRQITELEAQIDLPYTLENLDGLFSRSREGLRRIQQIVKDLKDFARLEESELEEVDLNAGIESTLNIVRGYAKRKGVQIVTDLGALPKVLCHAAKINQVVMNLVGNAIDASKNDGEVRIRSTGDASGVTIEIRDRGHGIPEAIRQKIFDPFFTTKPPGEGTGLGLSISYGIVHDHGGRIDVDSREGEGATFRIHLPLRANVKRDNR